MLNGNGADLYYVILDIHYTIQYKSISSISSLSLYIYIYHMHIQYIYIHYIHYLHSISIATKNTCHGARGHCAEGHPHGGLFGSGAGA